MPTSAQIVFGMWSTFQGKNRSSREKFVKPTLPEALWYTPCALPLLTNLSRDTGLVYGVFGTCELLFDL